MCKSLADGGARCAAHTRPAYTALMGDASLLPPAELRTRLDAHPDDLTNYAATKSGSAQISQDLYLLERTYEQALRHAPFLHRRRLQRDQQAVLAALDSAHTQGRTRRAALQQAADIITGQRTASTPQTPAPLADMGHALNVHRLTGELARTIIDRVRDTGGLTINPHTGHEPTTGYCINDVGDCPKIAATEFFTYESGQRALNDFLTNHHDWFTDTNNPKHIGLWHDTRNNVVVLDRVDVIDNLHDALRIGRQRNQRSMWDVAAATEINLQ